MCWYYNPDDLFPKCRSSDLHIFSLLTEKRPQSSVEDLIIWSLLWFDSLLPLAFEWPSFSSPQLPPWLHFLGLESSSLKAPSLLSDLKSNITSLGCLPYSPGQSSVLDGVVPSEVCHAWDLMLTYVIFELSVLLPRLQAPGGQDQVWFCSDVAPVLAQCLVLDLWGERISGGVQKCCGHEPGQLVLKKRDFRLSFFVFP